jgi:hypothetical protein
MRALVVINLSIKDEIIPHIFHLENPHELWIVVGTTRWLHAKKQLL